MAESFLIMGEEAPSKASSMDAEELRLRYRGLSAASRPDSSRSEGQAQYASQDRLIVGIDFGSSHSGVAMVHSAAPDDVEIVTNWPGGECEKVPTEISYETGGPRIPQRRSSLSTRKSLSFQPPALETLPENGTQDFRWGFQIGHSQPRLRYIKLFLDRSRKLPPNISQHDMAAHLRRAKRNIMDAVTDYLRCLRRHIRSVVSRRYGDGISVRIPINYVITVPAIWSDHAKHATLIAAEKAGMGGRNQLGLISEPEAATVHAFKTMRSDFIKPGNNILICDAGGATVDLITYHVRELSPLRLEEALVGNGALCGSAAVNSRFEDHIKERLGLDRFRDMQQHNPRAWHAALEYFEESTRRGLRSDSKRIYAVPLPDLPDDEEISLVKGLLILTTEEMKSIFDPVIEQILNLVQGQVNELQQRGESLTALLLVGGFSQSSYLLARLRAQFSTLTQDVVEPEDGAVNKSHVEVMRPPHAWTAVARGAAIRGLEGDIVTGRKSRRHYGTSYSTVFDESLHSFADRYWSTYWERWMVADMMQWHIKKGQYLSPSRPISFNYTRNFLPDQSLVVEEDLIVCDSETAPSTYREKKMTPLCVLITDLSAVPKHHFTRLKTSNGTEFDNIDYTLNMWVESANLVFELRVDGVKYGTVETDFHQ